MLRLFLLAAALALTMAPAQSQETKPDHTDATSNGTSPENMGSTGWTGGTGGSHVGTSNQLTTGGTDNSTPAYAGDAPWTATGSDLQGPPIQFPPNRTPE